MNTLPAAPSNQWKTVRAALVIAGVQVAGALLLSYARKQGWLDAEGVVRGAMVIIGLGVAGIGNMIPKARDGFQPPTLELAALRLRAMRMAGWSLTLGGLAFAGLSALAPMPVATTSAVAALGLSIAIMIGFVVRWIIVYHRATTL